MHDVYLIYVATTKGNGENVCDKMLYNHSTQKQHKYVILSFSQ